MNKKIPLLSYFSFICIFVLFSETEGARFLHFIAGEGPKAMKIGSFFSVGRFSRFS